MLILIRWHKNISVQKQNEFHDFVDTKYKIMKFILHLDRNIFMSSDWNPIEIRVSMEYLYQSSQFLHHCKGKSTTYLEIDIIFFHNFS